MGVPEIRLHYFDFHGGRGEAARLVMYYGNVPFDDRRIKVADWPNFKNDMPFGALPVLELDGEFVSQSNSINRYLGKLVDLYPGEPLQALYCDEVMDAVEDVVTKVVATFFLTDEDKKTARQKLCDNEIKLYLTRLNTVLEKRGGRYFSGAQLSVADLKVFLWVKSLKSGVLDHIPTDFVDEHAPCLVQQFEAISSLPFVKNYYQQFA